MYGQVISFLLVLLILYYVVMIMLDIQKDKAAKAAELEKNHEDEIDISDEASTFKPVMISRDEPKKEHSIEMPDTSETNEENGNTDSIKREGYREAYMTDGIPVEQIIQQVDEFAETGKGPLGEIICECRNAKF